MKLQTIDYKNHKIEVHTDDSPESPRHWDNLGTMVCFHKRHLLGDKHDFNSSDFNGWEDFKRHLQENHDAAIILPLYLYDHSGLSISTRPFSCPWDSGQVGFIFSTSKRIRAEYGESNPRTNTYAYDVLESEVLTYNDYLSGNVFGYVIKDADDNTVDSCWGFYPNHDETGYGYMVEQAKEVIDSVIKNK